MIERSVAGILLCVFLVIRAFDPAPLVELRLNAFDLINKLRPNTTIHDRVAIVDIDEQSLAATGQWPWPRSLLAELTRRIDAAGASVVGFDIVFPEVDRMSLPNVAQSTEGLSAAVRDALTAIPDNDQIFAQAIHEGQVVLGLSASTATLETAADPSRLGVIASAGADTARSVPSFPSALRPIPVLEEASAGLGIITILPDLDGTVRRLPLVLRIGDQLQPSLIAEMVRISDDHENLVVYGSDGIGISSVGFGPVQVPTDLRGQLPVYFGSHDPSLYVSAVDILDGTVSPDRLRGKLVLVGSTAAGIGDYQATSIHASLPSIEILAQGLGNLTAGIYLERGFDSVAIEFAVALLVAIALIIVLPRLGARMKLAAFLAAAGCILSITWLGFSWGGLLIDPVFPLLASTTIFGQLSFAGLREEERQRSDQEAALLRHHAFMRRLMQNLFDGLLTVDRGGSVRLSNSAASAILGVPADRIAGMPIGSLLPLLQPSDDTPGDPARALSRLAERMQPTESVLYRSDGECVDVDVAATRMEEDGDELFIVVIRDISARKQAEVAVDRSNRRLLDAVESASEGFALFDRLGQLTLCNTQFRDLMPVLANAGTPDAGSRDGGPGASERGAGALALLGSSGPTELWIPSRDGAALSSPNSAPESAGGWVRINKRPTSDGGFVVTVNDITEMKAREQELVEAKVKADAANQSKSDFLANMSHDLRTPLNAIIGFSEMMRSHIFGPLQNARYESYVDDILESARHLREVISRILDLAKIESGVTPLQETNVDLDEVVAACTRIMEPEASTAGVTITSHVGPGDLRLYADERSIKEIVINLLSNAVKFTPPGGSVHVGVREVGDGGFELEVSDTGIGIAENQIGRVTERFFRAEDAYARKYAGVGLGLSLVKGFVETHGGELVLESVLGKGTTAIVRLPSRRQPTGLQGPSNGTDERSGTIEGSDGKNRREAGLTLPDGDSASAGRPSGERWITDRRASGANRSKAGR